MPSRPGQHGMLPVAVFGTLQECQGCADEKLEDSNATLQSRVAGLRRTGASARRVNIGFRAGGRNLGSFELAPAAAPPLFYGRWKTTSSNNGTRRRSDGTSTLSFCRRGARDGGPPANGSGRRDAVPRRQAGAGPPRSADGGHWRRATFTSRGNDGREARRSTASGLEAARRGHHLVPDVRGAHRSKFVHFTPHHEELMPPPHAFDGVAPGAPPPDGDGGARAEPSRRERARHWRVERHDGPFCRDNKTGRHALRRAT